MLLEHGANIGVVRDEAVTRVGRVLDRCAAACQGRQEGEVDAGDDGQGEERTRVHIPRGTCNREDQGRINRRCFRGVSHHPLLSF
jgi:hypothetical protein